MVLGYQTSLYYYFTIFGINLDISVSYRTIFLRPVAYGVLNLPQLRGQEPAIEPVTDDAVCDVGSAGRSAGGRRLGS